MNKEMIKLNISLPVGITEELNKIIKPKKQSQFIAQAIQLLIARHNKKEKLDLLEEGYKSVALEGEKITGEFEFADLENWDEY